MAKVPAGQSVLSWDGAGQVWFMVFSAGGYTGGCKFSGGSHCFPEKCKSCSEWDLTRVTLLSPDALFPY